MNRFAVIDTETTWDDAVMSVGLVIADSVTFELVDKQDITYSRHTHAVQGSRRYVHY